MSQKEEVLKNLRVVCDCQTFHDTQLVVLVLYGGTSKIALASDLTAGETINLQSEDSKDSLQKPKRNSDDVTVDEETSSCSGDYSTVDEVYSLNASEWHSTPITNVFNENFENATQSNAAVCRDQFATIKSRVAANYCATERSSLIGNVDASGDRGWIDASGQRDNSTVDQRRHASTQN
uniref:Uncharacterized protein n=1 Tax=Ascaris lumbricoides TaxID=6252 RepID=A0A9J2Q0U2_ASCLU